MTGVSAPRLELYDWVLDRYAPRHIRNAHGDADAESARGQVAVEPSNYAALPRLILDGKIEYAGKTDTGREAVMVTAVANGVKYSAVSEVLPKRRMLALKTSWKAGRPPVLRP